MRWRWLGVALVVWAGGCGSDSGEPSSAAGGASGADGSVLDSAAGTGGGLAGAGAGGGGGAVVDAAVDAGDAATPDAAGDSGTVDPLACPPGAVLFEKLGLVHEPTLGNEYHRETFKPPPGDYAEARLQLEVYAPGWSDPTSAMRHMLFWFARDGKHFDLFAYAALVAKNAVLLRHGIGILAGDKPKLTAKAQLPMPDTYHVVYRYDMAGGVASLKLTRGTPPVPVAELTDVPNVTSISIGANQTVDVDLGNQGPNDPYPNPQEPPQYGWKFSDLRVCLIAK